MQKINKPEVQCEDPEAVQEPESCSEHVSHHWGSPRLSGNLYLLTFVGDPYALSGGKGGVDTCPHSRLSVLGEPNVRGC